MQQLTVHTCTNDCPFYRPRDENGNITSQPASEHVHFPTFALVAFNGDGTASISVPDDVAATYLNDPATFARLYPWFHDQGDRAPLATLA